MNDVIRPALASEAVTISLLAIASKAVWGYDEKVMAIFRDELRLTGDQLLEQHGHVHECDGEIDGYYTLIEHTSELIELEHLFVAAHRLGDGIGTKLFQHAAAWSRRRGFQRMKIVSDPNSGGFYERQGAQQTGEHQSSIPGRVIPIYEMMLSGI